jgi:glycosyltransferase involved in cell wall biosynthesis
MISVIIPALNEEYGIASTISSIPKSKIQQLGHDMEIIVVDGDSTDSTRDIAAQMGAIVIVEKSRGYGRAVKTGLAAAKGDIIVILDSDATYPAEFIPEYIEQLNNKDVDFITLNRFSETEKGAISFSHIIGNKILAFTFRLLYSINIKDSQSGMYLMKRNFIDNINVRADDFAFCQEIKIIAFKFFKSVELEGKYYKRIGKSKLNTIQDGWRNTKFLFEYRNILKFAIKPEVPMSKDKVKG